MKLKSLFNVAKEVVRHNIGLEPSEEFGNVPQDVQEKRIRICETNLCGYFSKKSRRCLDFGCFVDVKTKLQYDPAADGEKIKTKCPRNFW